MGRGLRMVGMGCGLAAVGGVGGYGMYQRRLKDNNAITAVEFHERQGANFTSIAQASRNQFLCQANSGLKLYRSVQCCVQVCTVLCTRHASRFAEQQTGTGLVHPHRSIWPRTARGAPSVLYQRDGF